MSARSGAESDPLFDLRKLHDSIRAPSDPAAETANKSRREHQTRKET